MSSDDSTTSPTNRADDSPAQDADRPRIIHSVDLLQGRREVWIEHGDEMYRLRLTANGKLYLSK